MLRIIGAVSPGDNTDNSSGASTSHPPSPLTQTVAYGSEGEFPSWITSRTTLEPSGSTSRLA